MTSFLVSAAVAFVMGATPAAHTGPKLTVCETVTSRYRAIGVSTEWREGERFNLMLSSDAPFLTNYVGVVIHHHGQDGQEDAFVREWQIPVEDMTRTQAYGTAYGLTPLAAGTYTIYAVDWRTRDVPEEFAPLTEYLDKVTITIKPRYAQN